MFCEKCGNQLSDDAVFCPKCGNRMGAAASQPTEQPVQQPVYEQPAQQPVYEQPVYQQPVQQPVYGQPPMPEGAPKKSKKGLIIGIVSGVVVLAAVVVLLLGFLVFDWFGGEKKSSDKDDKKEKATVESVVDDEEEETEDEVVADDEYAYGDDDYAYSDDDSYSDDDYSSTTAEPDVLSYCTTAEAVIAKYFSAAQYASKDDILSIYPSGLLEADAIESGYTSGTEYIDDMIATFESTSTMLDESFGVGSWEYSYTIASEEDTTSDEVSLINESLSEAGIAWQVSELKSVTFEMSVLVSGEVVETSSSQTMLVGKIGNYWYMIMGSN